MHPDEEAHADEDAGHRQRDLAAFPEFFVHGDAENGQAQDEADDVDADIDVLLPVHVLLAVPRNQKRHIEISVSEKVTKTLMEYIVTSLVTSPPV